MIDQNTWRDGKGNALYKHDIREVLGLNESAGSGPIDAKMSLGDMESVEVRPLSPDQWEKLASEPKKDKNFTTQHIPKVGEEMVISPTPPSTQQYRDIRELLNYKQAGREQLEIIQEVNPFLPQSMQDKIKAFHAEKDNGG